MQCQCVKKAEAFIQKHDLSTLVLLGTVVAVIGLISPSIMFAEELNARSERTAATAVEIRSLRMPASSTIARPGFHPTEIRGLGHSVGQPPVVYSLIASSTPEQADAQLQILKASLRSPEKALSDLESKVSYLQKQGIKVPDQVLEQMKQAQVALSGIKNAGSVTEAVNTGTPKLPALLESLNKAQPNLSKLAGWKQQVAATEKSLQSMKTITTQNKTLAAKLSKNKFDAGTMYKLYVSSTMDLRIKLAEAKGAVKNDSILALQIQKDIASQIEETAQIQKTLKDFSSIAAVSGTVKLGIIKATNNTLKKAISEGEWVIKKLKAQNLDTAALTSKLNEARVKSQEIIKLLSAKPVDKKAVSVAFHELMTIRQEFVKLKNAVNQLVNVKLTAPAWSVPASTWKIFTTSTVPEPVTTPEPVSTSTVSATNTI